MWIESSLCNTSNKIKPVKLGRWKREWAVEFQLSDSIWSSFSFPSLCLNLNETSDFEAVAKLLKVCQWVFASELKDTLRLAEQRGQRGPQHPAGQRCQCCTGMCVCICVYLCVCVCVCMCVWARQNEDQLKATTCIISPLNRASGQTQRRYVLLVPNLPSNRGDVCKRKGGGGGQQRLRSERWGSGMSLALHNITQCKQIAPASQQVAFS